MGIVRDLFYAKKMSAGQKLPAPSSSVFLKRKFLANNMGGEKTYSGPVVSFIGRASTEILALTAAITPIQDLHGYDHPWPAGGGKNLLPPYSTVETGGLKLTQDDTGRTIIDGIASTVVDFDIPLSLPSGTYTVSLKNPVGISGSYYNTFVAVYNAENTRLGAKLLEQNQAFTITGDVALFRIRIQTGVDLDNFVLYPMIELGSTETSYSPYSNICPITGRTGANAYVSPTQDVADATTYPVTWQTEAGTVYGGTVDVVTGVLTVDRAIVDLGTKSWAPSTLAGYTRFWTTITGIAQISAPNIVAPMLCSNYPTKTANQTYSGTTGVSLQQNSDQIYIYDPQTESMTGDEFKSAMSGVQLCYELATPLTYQLTPQTVAALVGQNYVWADTGDVTVTVKL